MFLVRVIWAIACLSFLGSVGVGLGAIINQRYLN